MQPGVDTVRTVRRETLSVRRISLTSRRPVGIAGSASRVTIVGVWGISRRVRGLTIRLRAIMWSAVDHIWQLYVLHTGRAVGRLGVWRKCLPLERSVWDGRAEVGGRLVRRVCTRQRRIGTLRRWILRVVLLRHVAGRREGLQEGLEGPGQLREPCSALRPGSLCIARIRSRE